MRPRHDSLLDLDPEYYPSTSVHQRDISAHFGQSLLREFSGEERQRLGEIDIFFILFTNRCGSNYLAELLSKRGLGVHSTEPFNRGAVLRYADKHGTASYSQYVLELVERWQRHDRAGFKIGASQLFWLTRIGLLDHFRSVRLINALRRDVVGQAVSFYIARQTGQWLSRHEEKHPREAIAYNGQEILQCLWNINKGRQLTQHYISVHQPPVLAVYYEELLADPQQHSDRIAKFLGVPQHQLQALDLAQLGLQKQGGELNREFRAAFEQDFSYQ